MTQTPLDQSRKGHFDGPLGLEFCAAPSFAPFLKSLHCPKCAGQAIPGLRRAKLTFHHNSQARIPRLRYRCIHRLLRLGKIVQCE